MVPLKYHGLEPELLSLPQSAKERQLTLELRWSRIEAGHTTWLRQTKDAKHTRLTVPRDIAADMNVRDLDSFRCGLIKTKEDLEAAVYMIRKALEESMPVMVAFFGYGVEGEKDDK